ncbi:MAG: dUTP diphosphatase [Opitutae bacterium]|nr:dUTP diphosphatase [Opitutae bacterium]MCD8298970.1 dUTP diphosphatase [Opitutae bacterium]
MDKLTLRIKKVHPDAVIPSYAKPGDAGMDLTAVSAKFENPKKVKVDFGIQIEIPQGYVGLLFPRSSVHKTFCRLSNSVGVIDSGYRGNVMAIFDLTEACDGVGGGNAEKIYAAGMRCAQLIIMPYPQVEVVEVAELSSSERGGGGFGSSGSK